MSEENVEIARSLYPGTVDIAVALLNAPAVIKAYESVVSPDFEGVWIDEGSGRRAVRGVEGFVTAWREWLSAWESWVVTPTEFIDVDDERVLVLMQVRARSKTHHVELPVQEGANLVTLQRGKVVRLELFVNKAEALEAAGLTE